MDIDFIDTAAKLEPFKFAEDHARMLLDSPLDPKVRDLLQVMSRLPREIRPDTYTTLIIYAEAMEGIPCGDNRNSYTQMDTRIQLAVKRLGTVSHDDAVIYPSHKTPSRVAPDFVAAAAACNATEVESEPVQTQTARQGRQPIDPVIEARDDVGTSTYAVGLAKRAAETPAGKLSGRRFVP